MPKRLRLNASAVLAETSESQLSVAGSADRQRLLALRLAAAGQYTAAQIAQQAGISRRQLFNWLRAFKTGGKEQLLMRSRRGGASPQIEGRVLDELRAGLEAGQWRQAKEIQYWLRERHRLRLSLSGIYFWLKKLGTVLQMPPARRKQKLSGSRGSRLSGKRRQAGLANRAWRHAVALLPNQPSRVGLP